MCKPRWAEGIVVKDTKFTFEVITKANELKTVPKEHTVFSFEVPRVSSTAAATEDGSGTALMPPLRFEIYGSQFETRAPERSNKKFRWHPDPDV